MVVTMNKKTSKYKKGPAHLMKHSNGIKTSQRNRTGPEPPGSESDNSSSSDIQFIQELKHVMKNHRCDLCCKGEFVLNKILRFGGVLNDKLKYACDTCQMGFQTKSLLSKHVCHSTQSLSESGLEKRINAYSSGSLIDYEDNCTGQQSSERKTRRSTNSTPMSCPACDKVCKSGRGLTNHYNKRHKDNSYHQCSLCLMTFSDFRTFRDHCAQHTVVSNKAYSCPACKNTFAWKKSLQKHICIVP